MSLQQEELLSIAAELGGEWEQVAVKLGISRAKIDQYKMNNPGRVLHAVCTMLTDWKRCQPRSIDYRHKLCIALKDVGRVDLAEQIRRQAIEQFDVEQCRRELRHSYYKTLCKVPQYPGETINSVPVEQLFIPVSIAVGIPVAGNVQKTILDSYNDMFKNFGKLNGEERKNPTRLLLLGDVGSGKSTLISKMVHDWAKQDDDSTLNQVPLLFALNLTNMKNVSLTESIVQQLLPKDTQITSTQIKDYIKAHQENVLFLLDGYDQLNHEYLSKDVLDLLFKDKLQNTYVVVTARPISADHFDRIYTYKMFELMGFSESNVESYVRNMFHWPHDRETRNSLNTFMTSTGLLPGIAKNPVMLLMLCHFWKYIKSSGDISTFTELYSALLTFMYKRASIKDIKTVRRPIFLSQWSRGISHEEEKLYKLVITLGKLAFDGLWPPPQNRTEFETDELISVFSSSKARLRSFITAVKMGLLIRCSKPTRVPKTTASHSVIPSRTVNTSQPTTLRPWNGCVYNESVESTNTSQTNPRPNRQELPTPLHIGDSDVSNDSEEPSLLHSLLQRENTSSQSLFHEIGKQSITFFHPSAQQKCAGEYLAHLASSSDKIQLAAYLTDLCSVQESLNRELMFRCACAASKDAAGLIIETFANIGLRGFQKTGTNDLRADESKKIQDFVGLCLKCNYESDARGQFNKQLCKIINTQQLIFLGISPYTMVAIGYYLQYLEVEHSVAKINITPTPRDATYCSVTSGPTARVFQEFKARLREKEHFEDLSPETPQCFQHGRSPQDGECYVQLRKYFQDWPTGGENNLDPLFDGLQKGAQLPSKGTQLKSLDLSEIPLKKQIGKLIKLVDDGVLKHLEELRLHRTDLREHDIKKLTVLKKLHNLHVLDISQNQAGSSLSAVIQGMCGLPLRILNLANMEASASATLDVATKIPEFRQLQELRLNGNDMNAKSGAVLSDTLQYAQQLRILAISVQNQKTDPHINLIVAISQLQNLQELRIHQTGYPEVLLKGMTEIMASNLLQVQILYLDAANDTQISTSIWSDFLVQMESKSQLHSLTILGFKLKSVDFQKLVSGCKEKKFSYLGYSENFIPRDMVSVWMRDAPFLELLHK